MIEIIPVLAATRHETEPVSTNLPDRPAGADDGWHFVVAPYLWIPWMYGTVGALDREVHVYATPGEIFSHFRFGLMGFVEADHKRIVLPLDMVWARFGEDKALPLPNVPSPNFSDASGIGTLAIQLFFLLKLCSPSG